MAKHLGTLTLLLLSGCGWPSGSPGTKGPSTGAEAQLTLPEARRGFQTRLVRQQPGKGEVARPPEELFRLVRYKSPAGELAAYLSPPPGDGKKRPAIVWLFGGFSNGISATAW